MADADVAITAGAGTKIDTRTVGAGTDEHRQVVVIGDPTTASEVAKVSDGAMLSLPDARHGSGVLAAAAGSTLDFGEANGAHSVVWQMHQTGVGFTGTVTLEHSLNGTSWFASEGAYDPRVPSGISWYDFVSQPMSEGIHASLVGGFRYTRLRVETVMDAAVAVTWHFILANPGIYALSGSAASINVTSPGVLNVGGNAGHDAVDSGNPVKIGGKFVTSQTAVASGDRTNIRTNSNGILYTALAYADGSEIYANSLVGDARVITGAGALEATGFGLVFNGTNWDRARNVDAYKTASATPDVGIAATADPDRRYTSVSLATAAESTQVWDANGADAVTLHVGTETTGTFAIEVTADGTNWTTANARDVVNDDIEPTSSITPNANSVYRVLTAGWRSVRVRTVTTLGAAVAFTATLSSRTPTIAQILTGPAPHSFGYPIVSETARYTTTQTSALLGPAISASQRMAVTSIQIQTGGTTGGDVVVYFGTGAYTRGVSHAVFDGHFIPSATSAPGYAQSPPVPYAGAADEELRVTTSSAVNPLTVTVWYYLVVG